MISDIGVGGEAPCPEDESDGGLNPLAQVSFMVMENMNRIWGIIW